MMIQCRLRELMAAKRRIEGRRVTYADMVVETGISNTTLTRLANDRSGRVAINTIDRLCAFFEVQPGDLFIYVQNKESKE